MRRARPFCRLCFDRDRDGELAPELRRLHFDLLAGRAGWESSVWEELELRALLRRLPSRLRFLLLLFVPPLLRFLLLLFVPLLPLRASAAGEADLARATAVGSASGFSPASADGGALACALAFLDFFADASSAPAMTHFQPLLQ